MSTGKPQLTKKKFVNKFIDNQKTLLKMFNKTRI